MRLPALLALALMSAACGSSALSGTDLGQAAAPDFTLTDGPSGEAVTLSAQRGKVVVLSFLYTNCPDVCPLTTSKFSTVRARLGDAARGVEFIAVSTDPAHDQPDATRRFLAARGMDGRMRFLVGDRPALAAVWAKYGVAAEPQGALVAHNDAIYLIDKQGRERALLHSDFDVESLARDLATLIGERRLF